MTELVLRFEHLVGRAALKLWSDLPPTFRNGCSRMLSVRMKCCAIISLCICTIIIRGPRIRQARQRGPKLQRSAGVRRGADPSVTMIGRCEGRGP